MRRIWLFLFLPLVLTQCTALGPEDEAPFFRELTATEAEVTSADNRFGLKLFHALSNEAPGENVFISPLSVSTALGMTLGGARGQTQADMQAALELSGLSTEEINAAYQGLSDLLQRLDPEVTFEIANSIWHREGFPVEPDFLDVNRTYFDAEVREAPFDGNTVEAINGWVDDKTHGKIDWIIESLSPETVMLLINAIYFKGAWTYEFDKDDTREDDFTNHDGTTTRVPMMEQEATLAYFETDTFQAVDLPYGDSLFTMTVLLPREGVDVDDVAASLDAERWADYTGRFAPKNIHLRLPRFKLEYKETLNDVLTALGMGRAFDPTQADFSGISADAQLFISQVLHKTFVEVDEKGTEAAAVTAVVIDVTSVGGGPQLVEVDRPFVFALRERHSGTILFIGKVNVL